MPMDFHKVLIAHAEFHNKRVPGQRRDWLMAYPKLEQWAGASLSSEYLQCEVKMGMYLLSKEKGGGEFAVGVSKNPLRSVVSWTQWQVEYGEISHRTWTQESISRVETLGCGRRGFRGNHKALELCRYHD
jgi:hypothetical protein